MSKRSYTRADKIHALKVVELCEGNLSAAARETGIPRVTLVGWVKERENQADELNLTDYSTPDGSLTEKQHRFVVEAGNSKSATEAARKAGYAHPRQEASRLLTNAVISERVQARIDARLLAAQSLLPDEIKGTLVDQMRGDLTDCTNDNGHFSLDRCRENGVTALLKRLDYDEFGSVKKFEIYSAQQAAKDLARILGMTQPKTQPINQINVVYVNDWRSQRNLSAESAPGTADSDESSPPI